MSREHDCLAGEDAGEAFVDAAGGVPAQLLGSHADPALKQIWKTDVTAVAHSLGISGAALARELSGGHPLRQIAAMHGIRARTPTTALVRHLREDLREASTTNRSLPRQTPCSTL